jgi:hypothetical protein
MPMLNTRPPLVCNIFQCKFLIHFLHKTRLKIMASKKSDICIYLFLFCSLSRDVQGKMKSYSYCWKIDNYQPFEASPLIDQRNVWNCHVGLNFLTTSRNRKCKI